MSSSTKTAFSSFKYPRPAPPAPPSTPLPPPTPPASVRRVLRKTGSEPSITRTDVQRRDKGFTYDYFAFRDRPIRQGYVDIQSDKLSSWSWTRRLWVVLDNNSLKFCPRKDAETRETVMLLKILKVQRVDTKPFCLMVAAASKTWYFLFKDSASFYDWYYDIRVRCPLLRIGPPMGFRHEMHVAYDHRAQEITGLPQAWIETLSPGGVGAGFSYDQEPPPVDAETYLSKPLPELPPPPQDIPQPVKEVRGPKSRQRSVSDATMNYRAETTVARAESAFARAETTVARAETTIARAEPTVARAETTIARAEPTVARAESTVASAENFRGSPHKYRDVEARDLTGVVRTVHLFPKSSLESCEVWKGMWSGSFGTRKVAVQVIRLFQPISEADRDKLSSIILQEVKALHQLRHPNVVRTRGFSRDHGPLPVLVSTWLSGGNIMDCVRNRRPAPEKGEKLKLLTQVASGVNYLHNFSRTIIHGELRGANILITDRGDACIAGFGLNPVMQELAGDSQTPPPLSTSPRWAAVEVILSGRRQVSSWSDVFSFGRTVLEVMTGKDPYHYLPDDADVSAAVLRDVTPRRPPVFADEGLWPFLERCWKKIPDHRPSMALALLRMEDILSQYQSKESNESNESNDNPSTENGHHIQPSSAPP